MFDLQPDRGLDTLMKRTKPVFSFDETVDFDVYKSQLKAKLSELLGIDEIKKNARQKQIEIEYDIKKDGYRLIRFYFNSEILTFIPCYLLIPDTGKKSYPLGITLQGHKSGGMYNSIGVVKDADDEEYQPRGAFALQAVKNGYAALCVELRGMGELVHNLRYRGRCDYEASRALMLGRTILGERVWDIINAIDLCACFPEINLNKIFITGNSGGGTLSFYAACMDERIKLCVPSCAFCTYDMSIMNVPHCICNYIPKAYNYFDMADLASLIAPRKLIIVAGQKDDIFHIDGVREGFKKVEKIYEKVSKEDNCMLIETPKGHYWCEDLVWPAINEAMKKIK